MSGAVSDEAVEDETWRGWVLSLGDDLVAYMRANQRRGDEPHPRSFSLEQPAPLFSLMMDLNRYNYFICPNLLRRGPCRRFAQLALYLLSRKQLALGSGDLRPKWVVSP